MVRSVLQQPLTAGFMVSPKGKGHPVAHSPRQGAGGMPMQMKYWKVMMHARKQQYLGQTSAMAFLLRRYKTAMSQQACIMA